MSNKEAPLDPPLPYYVRIIQDCDRGYQRCHECPMVACGDNIHPHRVPALERIVLDFTQQLYELKQKNKRLHELNESSMAVTRRHQGDAKGHRHRMKALERAIESNQQTADMIGEQEGLDEAGQQDLAELEVYIEGLSAAWGILDTERKPRKAAEEQSDVADTGEGVD